MVTLFSISGGVAMHFAKGERVSGVLGLLWEMESSLGSLRKRASAAMGFPKLKF